MSVSLYRKYRPQNFAGIIGQKAAVDVLTNSIAKNRAGHAYLFSGSRGCGKTSAARIFAKALNCTDRQGFEPCGKCRNCLDITAGESLDVIEIDGASNNGVENIRGLKENVTLSPFNSRYKIYIIDEVHMLSQGAFNALLKTLEEPPEHVIFIMATTEPHKVPVTIRSRCQHIPFHSITPDDIYSRLDYVCKNEQITAEPEALREISRQADGALRDALSLLEQISAAGEVTLANVEAVIGAGSRPAFERWVVSLRENPEEAYTGLKAMFTAGASSVRVFEEIFSLVRNLWLVSKWKNIADSLGISEQEKKFLLDESSHWKTGSLHSLLSTTLKMLTEARSGIRNDILLGMFMLGLEGGSEPSEPVISRREVPGFVPPRKDDELPQATEIPSPAAVPEPVKEDVALKEEILNLIHGKNFILFCALFDARPYLRGKELVLDIEHKYCFEMLKVYRTAAELSGILGSYPAVVLRYMSSEFTCPKPLDEPQAVVPEVQSAPKRKELPPLPETSAVESPEIPEKSEKREPSAFGRIIQQLAYFNMKPEIILHRHNEAEESDDTESETESEPESEGENE